MKDKQTIEAWIENNQSFDEVMNTLAIIEDQIKELSHWSVRHDDVLQHHVDSIKIITKWSKDAIEKYADEQGNDPQESMDNELSRRTT